MTTEVFEPDDGEAGARWDADDGRLVVDLDGYEGPLDVLLGLAREQKVDLARISILQLADQYIAFIEQAHELRLEIAADYLVMAAWLAYLKSRLLLPAPDDPEDPSGEELAAALAWQLRQLEAMREAGEQLMVRPMLGRDVFARGAPEGVRVIRHSVFELEFHDLLSAYADQKRRAARGHLTVAASGLYSMDRAMKRLTRLLGGVKDWRTLASFLPTGLSDTLVLRSAVAATLMASLELVNQGRLTIRQSEPFAPLYLKPQDEKK